MPRIQVEFSPHEPLHLFFSQDECKPKDQVVAQSLRGPLLATVVSVEEAEQSSGEPHIDRMANGSDRKKAYQQRLEAQNALHLVRSKSLDRALPMSFLSAFFTLDDQRLVFFFFAEERVDFRGLLRDITAVYPKRIELFQVKERDRSQIIGALGACGRVCCCSSWIREFSPVTVRMAKDQNLTSNPSGISGVCGKLRCCLRYEHEAYLSLRRELPAVGDTVTTPEGPAKVLAVNPLLKLLTVKLAKGAAFEIPMGRAVDSGPGCKSCGVAQGDQDKGAACTS